MPQYHFVSLLLEAVGVRFLAPGSSVDAGVLADAVANGEVAGRDSPLVGAMFAALDPARASGGVTRTAWDKTMGQLRSEEANGQPRAFTTIRTLTCPDPESQWEAARRHDYVFRVMARGKGSFTAGDARLCFEQFLKLYYTVPFVDDCNSSRYEQKANRV